MRYLGAEEWEPGLILCEGFSPSAHGYVYVKTAELLLGTHIQKALIMTTYSKYYSDNEPIRVKDFTSPAEYQIFEYRITSTHNNEYSPNLPSPIKHASNTNILSTNEVFSFPTERNKLETDKLSKSQNKRKLCIEKDLDVIMQGSNTNFNSKSQSYLEAFLDTKVCTIKDCIFRKIRYLKIGLIMFVRFI
jgi:hypothetical protein